MAAETLWRYIGVPARCRRKGGAGGNSIPDRISGTAQWTRVLFVSVGMAWEDLVIADRLYRAHRESNAQR